MVLGSAGCHKFVIADLWLVNLDLALYIAFLFVGFIYFYYSDSLSLLSRN